MLGSNQSMLVKGAPGVNDCRTVRLKSVPLYRLPVVKHILAIDTLLNDKTITDCIVAVSKKSRIGSYRDLSFKLFITCLLNNYGILVRRKSPCYVYGISVFVHMAVVVSSEVKPLTSKKSLYRADFHLHWIWLRQCFLMSELRFIKHSKINVSFKSIAMNLAHSTAIKKFRV